MYVTIQTFTRRQMYTQEFVDLVGYAEVERLAFEHYWVQEEYEEVMKAKK